jgi:hypothetical protein
MIDVAPVSRDDRELMKRWSIAIAFVIAFAFAFTRLELLYSHKFFDVTGRAQWIWDPHDLKKGDAIGFYAVRDFDLPPNRYFTKIKIVGDPEYAFWLNGIEIGGREVGQTVSLDEYDVSSIARTGRNRLVVALRSTDGVGGLLAAVDLSAEIANYVVTDGEWKIFRRWSPELILRDPPGQPPLRPMLLGIPPMRRWNYLAVQPGTPAPRTSEIVRPREVFAITAAMQGVKVVEGVAVRSKRELPATVFDFGPTEGRLRLMTEPLPSPLSRVVYVRFTNTREELRYIEGSPTPFVFAPGERTVIDPEKRHFRYALVYGLGRRADVLK